MQIRTLLTVCAIGMVIANAHGLNGQAWVLELKFGGIDSIEVVVEDLNDDVRISGLTVQSLQTRVELALRQNGIRVSSDESLTGAYIYINVNILPLTRGRFVYTVNTQLNRLVIVPLSSSPKMVFASVWDKSGIGYAPDQQRTRDGVYAQLQDQLNEFLNRYLTANPRR